MIARFTIGLMLLVGVVCAAEPRQDVFAVRQGEMWRFNSQVQSKVKELSALGALPRVNFNPQAPFPLVKPGETVVVSDAGMYFDNQSSCLLYVGNVRLNNERVRVRTAQRLYVLLPEKDKKTAAQEAANPRKPAAPQAKPAAGSVPKHPNPPKQETHQDVVEITSENAAVDVPGNVALLEGRRGSPSITMERQTDSLVMQVQKNGAPAWAYANQGGDVVLIGTRIVGVFTQDADRRELTAQQGPVFYEAATRTLTVYGPSSLVTAQGTLRSSEQMRITFAPGEAPVRPSKEPFAQFANMRLNGVECAEARGGVVCTMPEQQGRPAARATGDKFIYNAATGACCMIGKNCTFSYGGQSMVTSGQIDLLPNGDVTITGEKITGSYERPMASDQAGSKPIMGSYTTRGVIRYNASENSVIFPAGLSAKDTTAQFHCTGSVKVYLLREDTSLPPHQLGALNLSIARQKGVSHFLAEGAVRVHARAEGEQPEMDMSCDVMEGDLQRGTAHLAGSAGRVAHLRYGGHTLTAKSPKTGKADLWVKENGDLHATGDLVHAILPGEKGVTSVDCTRELFLKRAENTLTIGPLSTILSPDGILTARATLQAVLQEGEQPRLQLPKYPHLNYNYTGLRSASTLKGGTLQSAKLSMQYEGALHLEMLPGKTGDNPRDLIQTASAQGRVRLAGKDAKGRLIRADGDRVDFDHDSGNIYLRGSKVLLQDAYNTHTASGAGACVTIDPDNNVHISGERQTTTANQIHHQIDSQKKK